VHTLDSAGAGQVACLYEVCSLVRELAAVGLELAPEVGRSSWSCIVQRLDKHRLS
jgi:hypothetical protein